MESTNERIESMERRLKMCDQANLHLMESKENITENTSKLMIETDLKINNLNEGFLSLRQLLGQVYKYIYILI